MSDMNSLQSFSRFGQPSARGGSANVAPPAVTRLLPVLLTLVAALILAACSDAKPPERVHMLTGCDGPDGSCAKYLLTLDGDGAPTDRAAVLIPFSGRVKIAENPPWLTAVTAATNLHTGQT